ncbi:hypothetical protein K461DRAFT_311814 [Myriangium duriaei CBS 260.36]|uniref:Uncharacterized protein n=1 Tax=Myriangium duriaei CBS 260.36 TaxID=1168546 RepID=A0A9P4J5U6_9PEZI|nr:hypothetical protein K461DRAFT_311814 [Myriangium duriaei CBS 260.36]
MDFQPLFKPLAQANWGKPDAHNFIRGQFRIETFMIAGAILQTILSAVLPLRYAFIPAAFLALAKIADMYAVKTGLKKNPHMDGVIMAKFSAQFPDKSGNFGNQPARDGVCILMIGARNNGALGMFETKFAELGKYMNKMQDELKAKPEENGFLGGSVWMGTERTTSTHLMNIMYFKSAAHVHEYAHGPLHREAWTWWYNNIKDLKEMSIYHELYEVPSGNYEAIYDHMPPALAAATQHKVQLKSEQGTEEAWMLPVVDARKGQLKTSRGRMARSQGQENDKYGHNDESVYEEVREQTLV